MNNELEKLSPIEKRQWFLNVIKNNHNYNEVIKEADLTQIDLSNIDFTALNLTSTLSFENTCLKEANFSKATLDNINFGSAKLENANFNQATFKNVKFVVSQDKKAYLVGANFTECKFINKVIFTLCSLLGADFSKTVFSNGVSFYNADLYGSKFTQTLFNIEVDFSHAQLINVDFREIQFRCNKIYFYDSNIENANFSKIYSELTSANNLYKAKLNNQSISNFMKKDIQANRKNNYIDHSEKPKLLLSSLIIVGLFSLLLALSANFNTINIIVIFIPFLLGTISLAIATNEKVGSKILMGTMLFLIVGIILIGITLIILLISLINFFI